MTNDKFLDYLDGEIVKAKGAMEMRAREGCYTLAGIWMTTLKTLRDVRETWVRVSKE